MFRFAQPIYLYLLLLIPVLVAVFVAYRRAQRKRLRRFGEPEIIGQLMPEASPRRVRNKFILLMIAMTLITFALAQPQFGAKLREVKREGVEIMFVVDVSNSMMATDLTPNRLARTKNAISRMVEHLGKDRVGMVVFAGEAYVQLPITSDYVSAKKFIDALSNKLVPVPGTSVAQGIDLAARSFSDQSHRSRVMILITDGESHDDDPIAAAQIAADQGIIMYTVGIGTPEGSPITLEDGYVYDEEGKLVVSKLDEQTLQQIAVLSGGMYVRATNQSIGLDEILRRIGEMEKQEFSSLVFEEFNDQFYYLAVLALLLLLSEFLMIDRKNRLFGRISVFK